jgi:hypothetical protein
MDCPEAICSGLDIYRTADWESTLAPCLRHVSFALTQPPRSSLATKGHFTSQWPFLPSLVCAQNCLLAAVLTKALFPALPRSFSPRMDFQPTSDSRPISQGHHGGGGMCVPWGAGLLSISSGWNYPGQAPKLLEIRSPVATGITAADTEPELTRQGKLPSAERSTGSGHRTRQG